ncbi:MAG: DUF447 domain-containing protein [Planctomycetia bacterium]
MILEGLVTTIGADGGLHVAAMGPHVDDAEAERFATGVGAIGRLLLRPFPSSQTARNLLASRQGVFHVIDDVLLVARVVTGVLGEPPATRPATGVAGRVLEEACRAYEFEGVGVDDAQERLRLDARVRAVHEGRPFLGFNRGRHAVVEGAILVTRLHILEHDEVDRRFRELAVLVQKTGGPREHEAFRLLETRVSAARSRGLPTDGRA